MSKKNDPNEDLLCSFCGKSQDEVKKLIAGPSVYICDECIQLCNEIIAEESGQEIDKKAAQQLPKPSEIKGLLDQYVIEQERPKKIDRDQLASYATRKGLPEAELERWLAPNLSHES